MSTPDLLARTPRSRRSGPAVLLSGLLAATALLAGCGHDASTSSAAPRATRSADAGVGTVTSDAQGVQQVTLETGDDYVFTPDHFTVAPGQVQVTVRNTGKQLTHQFEFTQGKGPAPITQTIPILPPGSTESVSFTVTTPGDYQFDCTFHLALGQIGTMTVSG